MVTFWITCIDVTRELLQYGLSGTDLETLIALADKDTGEFIRQFSLQIILDNMQREQIIWHVRSDIPVTTRKL